MPFLTKDKVRQIIQNRPAGTSPEGVVSALRSQGHQLEGYPGQERGLLDPVPVEEGPTIGGFAKNVAKSAGRLVRDVGSAALHPIETTKTLGKLAVGTAANTVETITGNEQLFNAPGEDIARGLGQDFMNRYSDEGIGKTLYEDPVGAVSDVATVISGAGAGAKLAGAATKSSKLATAGKVLSQTANTVDPVAAASRGVGKAVEAGINVGSDAIKGTAERLYQSALKPTKAVETKFPNVVRTGLDRGVVVSRGGLDRVSGKIDEINNAISTSIAQASEKGTVIHTSDVIKALDDTKEFFGNAIGGSKFIEQIDDLAKTFRRERGKTITVEKAQEVKKATYSILRKAYGELKSAETEGTKALARGLKEEIAAKVKGIAELNAEESKLIGLESALEDFVRRNGNSEILGLSGAMGVGAGAAAAGFQAAAKAGITARVVKAIFDNPAAKSQLSIFLNGMAGGASFSGRTSRALGQLSELLRLGELSSEQ